MRTPWMILLLPVMLYHCSDGGSSIQSHPQPSFALALDPVTLTLNPGDTKTVAVTITRSGGFSDPVHLELVGPKDGVSATFDPNPAVGEDVTLTLSAAAAIGLRGLYVKATSGNLKQTSALEVTVLAGQSLSVTGRVVDVFRQPLAGLEVTLAGTTQVTGADGSFAFFDGATAPYNLVVRRASPLEGHVFVGLTRPDPVLVLVGTVPAQARAAQVSGTLTSPGSFPLGAAEVTMLFVTARQGFGGLYLFPGDGPSFGPFEADWYGDASMAGTLHALRWSVNAQLLPAEFLAYGEVDATFEDGIAATGKVIALDAAATGYLSGSVTVPDGFTVAGKTLWLTGGPFTGLLLGVDATAGETFTYATPDVGLPIGVQALATRGAKSTSCYRSALIPNEVIAMGLPAPPLLQTPENGATGVTTATPLSWSAYANAIHVVFVVPATRPSFVIYLAGTSTTIPDLTDLGLSLASSAAVTWSVWGVSPFVDLDAYTAPERGLGLNGLDEDVCLGVAEAATFTTAP